MRIPRGHMATATDSVLGEVQVDMCGIMGRWRLAKVTVMDKLKINDLISVNTV